MKGVKRWVVLGGVLGVLIGSGIAIVSSLDLINDETKSVRAKGPIELKVEEEKNYTENKEKLGTVIKEINAENEISYDSVNFEKNNIYIKTYVFELNKNMAVDGDYVKTKDKIVTKTITTNKKSYAVLNSIEPTFHIEKEMLVNEETDNKEKIQIFLLEGKIKDDGSIEEIKKEKSEFNDFKERKNLYKNFSKSEKDNYDLENLKKEKNETDAAKKAIEIVSDKKYFDYEYKQVYNSKNRYYFVNAYNSLEGVYVIGDREKNKIYLLENKENELNIRDMFVYKDKVLALEGNGNILELEFKDNGFKSKVVYENKVRNKSATEFTFIGMEGDYVYFRNYQPVDSLMGFNLKTKEFKTVYNSRYNTMESMDMKDGYIVFYKNPNEDNEKAIGKLKDGNIEIVVDNIKDMNSSETFINENMAIMISTYTDLESKESKTKIKIFKL